MRCIFYTFLFGNDVFDRTTSPYFASFIKSMEYDSVAVMIIFTNVRFPHILKPPVQNFMFVNTSWDDIGSRADKALGLSISHRYRNNTHHAKIMDFKPLMPMLYPEKFAQARKIIKSRGHTLSFIAWMDNDLWMSSAFRRSLIDMGYRQSVDMIGMIGTGPQISWGPFTAIDVNAYYYRIVPTLKQNLHLVLPVLEDPHNTRMFDEWGEVTWGGLGYNHSFSHIISLAKLTITPPPAEVVNSVYTDVDCCGSRRHGSGCDRKDLPDKSCAYCRITLQRNRVLLTDFYNNSRGFCHFHFSKKVNKGMMNDKQVWIRHLKTLLRARPIASNFDNGILTEII
mmetsp:Transcript_9735/g.9817  ORF Transcript_9735/g.9817 Transcript_9735/m.9817 type:complete len:339 (-) Transcript_9735:212-1228(-)